MNKKELAETVGLVAIVASLVFVGLQLRQAENIGLAEGYSAIFANRLEASNSIKEHADLWRKGAAGEKLNESEAAIFAVLLNQVNESAVQGFVYAKTVAGMDEAQTFAQDFAIFLYLNPGARAIWNEREDSLAALRRPLTRSAVDHPWTVAVRNHLAELDRVKPQIDETSFVDW